MKKTLLVLSLLFGFGLISAQKITQFKLQGIVGTRLHTGLYETNAARLAWPLKSSLLLGFELSHAHWPAFSIAYLHDRTYWFYNESKTYPLQIYRSNILGSIQGNYLGITYQHKNFRYSLGHYWNLFENSANTTLANVNFTNRDIALSFAYSIDRIEFEAVKTFRYFLSPGIKRLDMQHINIKYRVFEKKKAAEHGVIERKSWIVPQITIGTRGFFVKNTRIPGEGKDILGISFLAGVEFRFQKTPLSLFAERDWWVRLNAGSPYRDVKGYVCNSVVGLKYTLPKLQNAYFSLGYDWTRDHNTLYQTREKIAKGEEKIDLYIYNVKGIALGIGIPIFKKFELDFRSILPLRGEKIGNRMRFSLGAAYKINP